MRIHTTCVLSTEEAAQLYRAQLLGGVSARIYTDGVFCEDEFVAYGVFQRLVIRGLLTYVGLTTDGRTMAYAFTPTHRTPSSEPANREQLIAA